MCCCDLTNYTLRRYQKCCCKWFTQPRPGAGYIPACQWSKMQPVGRVSGWQLVEWDRNHIFQCFIYPSWAIHILLLCMSCKNKEYTIAHHYQCCVVLHDSYRMSLVIVTTSLISCDFFEIPRLAWFRDFVFAYCAIECRTLFYCYEIFYLGISLKNFLDEITHKISRKSK